MHQGTDMGNGRVEQVAEKSPGMYRNGKVCVVVGSSVHGVVEMYGGVVVYSVKVR